MNDNNTITRADGSRYEYDADFDCYRRIPEPVEMTHMLQWGWIYVCLLLCVMSYIIAVHGK